jgi:hypothetical protein
MTQLVFFLPHLLFLSTVGFIYWRGSRPSAATRQQVEDAVKAKGMELIDLSVSWKSSQRDRNHVTFVARCRNPFGNVQREYFSVNLWANALGKGAVVSAASF